MVQRAQVDQAESQLGRARNTQQELAQHVQQLQNARQCTLEEISGMEHQKLNTSLEQLQQTLQQEFVQQQQSQQVQFQQTCQQLLHSTPPSDDEDEEPPTKKLKVEEGQQMEHEEETTNKTSGDATDATITAAAPEKPSLLKRKQLEVLCIMSPFDTIYCLR